MTGGESRRPERLWTRFARKAEKMFYNRGPQPTFCLPFCLMV